jgi:hypothetical protein
MRDRSWFHADEIAAIDQDLTRGGKLIAEDQAEQRAFAGPAGAGQEDKLSFLNVKANIDQGFQIFPICLIDMVHLDHGVPALVDLPLCASLRATAR